MSQPGHQEGLVGALRSVTATLLATGQARLALLGNEIEVEKLRAFRVLVLTQALMLCLGLTVVLATFLVIFVLNWPPALVLSALAALFFIASGFFCWRLTRAARQPQPLFAASLAEMQEDLRQLKSAAAQ